jgi:hypothetical protein
MKGILDIAKQARESAKWNRAKAAAIHTDPRIAHDAESAAKRSDAEAEKLERMARSDRALIDTIELLIHDIATSSDQSPSRTLAMRDLENASSRLRRELGYQES